MRTTPIRNAKLKFAILRHFDFPGRDDHFDILLEVSSGEDEQQTALVKFETNSDLASGNLLVEHKGLVRRRYLRYEGPMTGNRGHVERVDRGSYVLRGMECVDFNGVVLRGRYFLDSGSPCEILRSIKQIALLMKI